MRALIDQTYHFDFILGTRQFGEHLAFCARLASKIAIYRLRWTPLSASTGEFGSIIHQHLEGADNNPTSRSPIELSRPEIGISASITATRFFARYDYAILRFINWKKIANAHIEFDSSTRG